MKRATCLVAIAALMMLNTGCANGPIARMLRGGECSSCSAMPAPSETYPYAYSTETSGTCGPNGCGTGYGWSGDSSMAPVVGVDTMSGGLPGVTGTGGFGPAPGPTQ